MFRTISNTEIELALDRVESFFGVSVKSKPKVVVIDGPKTNNTLGRYLKGLYNRSNIEGLYVSCLEGVVVINSHSFFQH